MWISFLFFLMRGECHGLSVMVFSCPVHFALGSGFLPFAFQRACLIFPWFKDNLCVLHFLPGGVFAHGGFSTRSWIWEVPFPGLAVPKGPLVAFCFAVAI